MPDRSGRHCIVCGHEGVQIIADRWVCSVHAGGQRTDIRCNSCGVGHLIVRWEVAPKPVQISPVFDDGPIGPLKIETYRFVTCSQCVATARMPESVLAAAVAAAKAEEEKRQIAARAARLVAEQEAEQRREAERIAREAADAQRRALETLRLQREGERIQAELRRLAEQGQVVESRGRHVEVPDD